MMPLAPVTTTLRFFCPPSHAPPQVPPAASQLACGGVGEQGWAASAAPAATPAAAPAAKRRRDSRDAYARSLIGSS